jgi:DNA-binding LytR/AlgR family response regulator
MKELKPNETFLKKENYYIAKLPITEGNETTLLSLDQIIYIEANGAVKVYCFLSNNCRHIAF